MKKLKEKDLADQFNNELSNITNQISIAEQQSSSLQQQVQDLNIELTNETNKVNFKIGSRFK